MRDGGLLESLAFGIGFQERMLSRREVFFCLARFLCCHDLVRVSRLPAPVGAEKK